MRTSFPASDDSFWERWPGQSSLVIINLSRFFPNVSARFTERLARQICQIVERYPMNRYVIIAEHAEGEDQINAYNVFKQVIGSAIRSAEHTSELQSRQYLVCRLLLEKTKTPISRILSPSCKPGS